MFTKYALKVIFFIISKAEVKDKPPAPVKKGNCVLCAFVYEVKKKC